MTRMAEPDFKAEATRALQAVSASLTALLARWYSAARKPSDAFRAASEVASEALAVARSCLA